jgi:hypothetical protein
MTSAKISPLVLFPDDIYSDFAAKDEYQQWYRLQQVCIRNEHKEDSLGAIIQFHEPISSVGTFMDLQLKYYLIRSSHNPPYGVKGLPDLIDLWVAGLNTNESPFLVGGIIRYINLSASHLARLGRYYYFLKNYVEYIDAWNKCSVDLNTWKKFRYLSIPDDFNFLGPGFQNKGGLGFSLVHMRKLFNVYTQVDALAKLTTLRRFILTTFRRRSLTTSSL